MTQPKPIDLAQVGYQAYGDWAEWKNYAGLPMPTWEELPEPQRNAWVAAGRRDLPRDRHPTVGVPVTRPLVHIAGSDVQVGSRLRQRCAWCGATLIDYDLERIAVPEGTDPRPATWPVGDLVAVDGGLSYVVDHEDGRQLPDNACGVLDAEVTV